MVKSSGISATAARKHLGIHNIAQHAGKVKDAIEEAERIHECIEYLSVTQEKALLLSLGIPFSSDSESDASSSELEDVSQSTEMSSVTLSEEPIVQVLRKSGWNWFECLDQIEQQMSEVESDREDTQLNVFAEKMYSKLISSPELQASEKKLLEQSHDAYEATSGIHKARNEHEADAFNGYIVEDYSCQYPEDVHQLKNLSDPLFKTMVVNRRKAIRRHARYLKHKCIAEKNFFARKSSCHVSRILAECPDIGTVIEEFVESRNIGADAWRRTRVLTFDGNAQVKKKVTFEHIRQHLETTYKRKFSYGTVVQLCVARNKCRKSAMRYKEVAKVTCRKARKGFALKLNPDTHWSSALYRGLNYVQYADGTNIMNVNRDDAAGFRLDTMSTHRLHKTPVVQGKEALTTRTDLVNRYPSILQTSSYNFAKTATTIGFCAGVVKANGLYPKNPAQHAADIQMLEELPQIGPAFINPITNRRKEIECVRVDGACDEGPSHDEIQFYWTERHYTRGSIATLVSARSSGASYLNRVELQNGCMCCGNSDCCRPACSSIEELPLWFPGGPSVQYLPVCDPERPWGNKACKTCKGECFGHYLLPEQAVKLSKHHKPMSKPPSIILAAKWTGALPISPD